MRKSKNTLLACFPQDYILLPRENQTPMQKTKDTPHTYAQSSLQSELSKYDSDDFTVVLQPFFLGVPSPDNVNTIFGEAPDLSLFAPDCFHFSQRSNALSNSPLSYEKSTHLTRNSSVTLTFSCKRPLEQHARTGRQQNPWLVPDNGEVPLPVRERSLPVHSEKQQNISGNRSSVSQETIPIYDLHAVLFYLP